MGHLSAWFRAVSRRFDALIAALLTDLIARLARSRWHDHDSVAHLIDRLRDHQGQSAAGIVTHTGTRVADTHAVAPNVARIVARGTSFGFAGLLVVGIWWSMPGFEHSVAAPSAQPAQAESAQAETGQVETEQTAPTPTATPSVVVTRGLAVVNPVNVQAPTATATPGAILAAPTGAAAQPNAPAQPALVQPQIVTAPHAGGANPAETVLDAAGTGRNFSVLAAGVSQAIVAAMLVPTPTFEPVATQEVPFVQLVPEIEFRLPGTTPTPTPTLSPTPTPVPIVLTAGRLWSNFQPRPSAENDHFWVERPFPDFVGNQLASPSYQFGSTAGNRYRVHHGLDISNPVGTPVRAGTTGEVVHAGWDDPDILGPYGGFYGNAVVIRLDRRLPVAGGELDVFVLYGHLNEVLVAKGQRVGVDDIVGRVGMTGIAIGPHLHVEMRIGANTYQHSVNSDLWVRPLNDGGAVAVRVLTADGRTWAGARVSLARFQDGQAVWARQIETYQDTENIGPDPAWGENGAMGSVPPGNYVVVTRINGETLRTEIDVRPGETTFVELRTQQ